MNHPSLVVLDGHTLNPGDNPWGSVAALGTLTVHDRTPASKVITRARGATVVLTNKTPLPASVIDALPDLRFIGVLATGYNVVDVAAARRRGIPVSNVPTYGTSTVAQHVFALILELCHHVGRHADSVRSGDWSASPDFCYWKSPLLELEGRTLGLVGRGRIANRVAEIARAFGLRVRFASCSVPAGDGRDLAALDELFSTADIVSLHCALTPASTGLVNAARLARMKPGALLINTARGALIDEPALRASLEAGHLGGAALDVLSVEPPPLNHPLLSAPRCLITPHMAWSGLDARKRLMDTTVANISAFLSGQPINVVN